MDPVHREVLDTNHSQLVTSLRASDVMGLLLKDDVINKYDYDQMKRTEAQGSRAVNRLLLLTLRRRGGDAYPALHRALRETGQDDLCDVMLDSELNLREGLATERMERNLASYSYHPGLKGLSLSPALADGIPARAADPYADSPVLRKATSPAFRNAPFPSSSSTTTPRDGHPSQRGSPLPKGTPSPAPSSSGPQGGERERQIQQLQQELQELRQSHSKVETELKQQIEQLQKDKEAAQKKGGGCVVM